MRTLIWVSPTLKEVEKEMLRPEVHIKVSCIDAREISEFTEKQQHH